MARDVRTWAELISWSRGEACDCLLGRSIDAQQTLMLGCYRLRENSRRGAIAVSLDGMLRHRARLTGPYHSNMVSKHGQDPLTMQEFYSRVDKLIIYSIQSLTGRYTPFHPVSCNAMLRTPRNQMQPCRTRNIIQSKYPTAAYASTDAAHSLHLLDYFFFLSVF